MFPPHGHEGFYADAAQGLYAPRKIAKEHLDFFSLLTKAHLNQGSKAYKAGEC